MRWYMTWSDVTGTILSPALSSKNVGYPGCRSGIGFRGYRFLCDRIGCLPTLKRVLTLADVNGHSADFSSSICVSCLSLDVIVSFCDSCDSLSLSLSRVLSFLELTSIPLLGFVLRSYHISHNIAVVASSYMAVVLVGERR